MPLFHILAKAQQIAIRILYQTFALADLGIVNAIGIVTQRTIERDAVRLQAGNQRRDIIHFDLKINAAAERPDQFRRISAVVLIMLQHELRIA